VTFGIDFGAIRGDLPELVVLVNDWFVFWQITQFELPFVWKNPFNKQVQRLLGQVETRNKLLEQLIDKCLRSANEQPTSTTGAGLEPFIQLVCRAYLEGNRTGTKLTHSQLAQIVFEMIAGGTDTSVNSMAYILLFAVGSTSTNSIQTVGRNSACHR